MKSNTKPKATTKRRRNRSGVANTVHRDALSLRDGNDPNATRTDPGAIGTRQPPHGVSQENSSNAMVAHPTEVGGTRPAPPVPDSPDFPKTA